MKTHCLACLLPDHVSGVSRRLSAITAMVCFDLMSLTAVPVMDLLHREHPELLAGLEMDCGLWKKWHTKGVISLKRDKTKSSYSLSV